MLESNSRGVKPGPHAAVGHVSILLCAVHRSDTLLPFNWWENWQPISHPSECLPACLSSTQPQQPQQQQQEFSFLISTSSFVHLSAAPSVQSALFPAGKTVLWRASHPTREAELCKQHSLVIPNRRQLRLRTLLLLLLVAICQRGRQTSSR